MAAALPAVPQVSLPDLLPRFDSIDRLVTLDKRALANNTLDFVAIAPGTPVDRYHVESYHTGAGTSVLALFSNDPTDYCSFYLRNGDLAQSGGTSGIYSTAYIGEAFNHSDVINFNIGLPIDGSFGLDYVASRLTFNGSDQFFACPPAILPLSYLKPTVVGVGIAPQGCYDIALTTANCAIRKRKCQVDSGDELYPNFIVPVQAAHGDATLGTQYVGKVFTGQSLDISFYTTGAGTMCDLLFHLPGTPSNPGNGVSSYTLGGNYHFTIQQLAGEISSSTTYNNRPARIGDVTPFNLAPGQTTFLATTSCQPNAAMAFEITAVGDSSIEWTETSAAPGVGVVLLEH